MPRPNMSLSECAREDAIRHYGSDKDCVAKQRARRARKKIKYEQNRRERILKDKA
jgi:hypothetical protein